MHIVAYIHPIRTYLPCTGVGRHINNVLHHLARQDAVRLQLLYSAQWLQPDGRLDTRSPLRPLPAITYPQPENALERSWKLLDAPKLDKYLPPATDWLYAPVPTYLPVTTCPLAVTIHDVQAFETDLPWSGSLHHRWFRLKWSIWVRRALARCRVVFTVSAYSKRRMVDLLGADPVKVVVVGNGVEPAFFAASGPCSAGGSIRTDGVSGPVAAADPAGGADHKGGDGTGAAAGAAPYVLVVGGLRRWKGADYVLATADALRQQGSEVEIVVTGNSEDSYAAAGRRRHNVRLLGVVPDAELVSLLRRAVALLFLSPYEGFGIPALEAMAAGTPVVAAARAALPEVVGDAGIVLDPTATGEVAAVVQELARNPGLRSEYRARGLRHAPHYTWEKCAGRVLHALEQFA